MPKNINQKISESRKLLQNPYAYLDDNGNFSALPEKPFYLSRNDVLGNVAKKAKYSDQEIAVLVKKLQNKIWKHRTDIWDSNTPTDPIHILDPSTTIEVLGYCYKEMDTLGQFSNQGKAFEVAGIIDSEKLEISISNQFPRYIKNFTAAHELGHLFMHQASGLHRDRALDGTLIRSGMEFEADKFATFFLMPESIVRATFKQIYGFEQFVLNEETEFALNLDPKSLLAKGKYKLRDLSLHLASAEFFNGQHFSSLASQFKVSNTAMARRLEELNLLIK